jgi:hypothetical protein
MLHFLPLSDYHPFHLAVGLLDGSRPERLIHTVVNMGGLPPSARLLGIAEHVGWLGRLVQQANQATFVRMSGCSLGRDTQQVGY